MTATNAISPALAQPRLLLVRLDKVRRDGGTQSRAQLDSATAARYAEDLRQGAKFPEMVLFHGTDDRDESAGDEECYYWLASGFHRYEAHEQCGIKATFCRVYQGSVRDAILYSVGENYKHGLQRSVEDKRHAVRLLLSDRQWRERADQWIAEKCHVSRPLVASVREGMFVEWELEEKRLEKESIPDAPCIIESDSRPDGNSASGAATAREDPGPSSPQIGRSRITRCRHGGTVSMRMDGMARGTAKVKPVIVETETREIARKMSQVVRSIPKAIRQAKALAWTWDEFAEVCRKSWDDIPVSQE